MKFFNRVLPIFLVTGSILYAQMPTKESVTKLYVATFNRTPDSAGLNYWINDSGLSLEGIAKSFFDQPETKKLYSDDTSVEDFVRAVYGNLFNREPDDAGLKYWANELRDNPYIDRSVFILAVMNGVQNGENGFDKDILDNKEAVGEYFADQGLNDPEEAREVMKNVDASAESVNNAISIINSLILKQLMPISLTD